MGIASIHSVKRMPQNEIIPWQLGMIKTGNVKTIRRFKDRAIYNQTIEALLSVCGRRYPVPFESLISVNESIKTKTLFRKDNMQSEYDFDYSKAKKNRFEKDYHISVTLDSDVAGVFKNSESVNKALRAILTAVPNITKNDKDLAQKNAVE